MRIFILLAILCFSCSASDDSTYTDDTVVITDDIDINEEADATSNIYFPPIDSDTWETISPETLNWDIDALEELNTFVAQTNAKAFLILKDGRIVVENYYQNTDAATLHRWNSAAKTLTAYTVGIAQQENYLNINDSSSDYLGSGWTQMTSNQEQNITIKNQLTMTTGGDYNVADVNCTNPECLTYLNPAGSQWFYHNAYYTLLQEVVSGAIDSDFDTYFESKIQAPTGITGTWVSFQFYRLYYSTARSMARFGTLNLNNGNWDGNQIIDADYFTQMTTPSQDINEAYGYLWWLNGQESFRLPGTIATFTGKLIPTAPDDLIAGLGKDDQKVYVVPSEGLVVIRLGDASGDSLPGPSGFDTALWEKIMLVVQ